MTQLGRLDACRAVAHNLRPIGRECAVHVVVANQRYDIKPEHMFQNNLGHARGLTPGQQEAAERRAIEQLRLRTVRDQRARKLKAGGGTQGHEVVGAIPAALLFARLKQHGSEYLKNPREAMLRDGAYWGR